MSTSIASPWAGRARTNGHASNDNGNGRSAASSLFTSGADLVAALGFDLSPQLGGAESVTRPYAENAFVRAAIKAKSRAFASLPLALFATDPRVDDEAAVLPEHPLYKLFGSPNPYQIDEEFRIAHTTGYSLDGESYWFLMDENGRPLEAAGEFLRRAPATIIAVRGKAVEVKHDERGFPALYRYQGLGGKQSYEFPRASVIPFLDHDPDDPTRGVGDTEVCARAIDLMYQAERGLDSTIRHGGDNGAWITFEQRLDVSELQRRQELADQDAEVQNAGRYTVLDEGAKVTPKPVSVKFTEYPEFFRYFIQVILSGHGVPPPVIGIYDEATYNNVATAYLEFWQGQNGVLAFASYTANVIKQRLLQRLSRVEGWNEEVWPVFSSDHIAVLKAVRSEQLKTAVTTSAAGIGVSVNEALRFQGTETELPEFGDKRFVSGLLVELDEDGNSPTPAATSDGSTEEESAGKAAPANEKASRVSSTHDDAPRGGGTRAPAPPIPGKAGKVGRLKPLREPDAKLFGNVTRWLSAYERAQIARLRAVAAGAHQSEPTETHIAISESEMKTLLLAEEEWAAALKKATAPRMHSIYKIAAQEIASDVGASILDLTDPRVIRKFAEHLVTLSEGATSTLAKRMHKLILDVLAKDVGGPASIRELIRRNLPELTGKVAKAFATKEQRAMMIARTETNWARNNGAHDQATAAGARWKGWKNSNDDAVRLSHRIDVRVPIDQRFPNGLMLPHEEGAPASEVIGCRCGALYFF